MHFRACFLKAPLFVLFICLPFLSTHGQHPTPIQFQHYGLKQGMPDATVYDLIQDRHGFLWITTQSGIVRYDGVEFTQFLPPEANGKVRKNLPDRVLEDHDGGIWVGYQLHSLIAQYDSVAGDFIYHDLNELAGVPGGVQHTRLLGIDKNNRLWVALNRYHNPEEPWVITMDTETGEVDTIYIDEEGNSLFTDGYFIRLQYGSMGLHAFLSTPEGVWLGASNATFFAGDNGEIRVYDQPESSGGTLGAASIDVIHGEEIWLSTNLGCHRSDPATDSFRPVDGLPEAVMDTTAYKAYEDSSGNVWITGLNGSYRIRNGSPEPLTGRDDLSELPVAALYPKIEDDRYIWFINKLVTPGEKRTDGITVYDKETDQFRVLKADPDDAHSILSNPFITLIMQDQNGAVWVGDFYSGLAKYDTRSHKFSNAFGDPAIRTELGNHHPLSVRESPEGTLWTGTSNGQIYVTDPGSGASRKLHAFENLRQINTDQNYIFDIYFQQSGLAWVATEWSGLQRLHYNPETLEIDDIDIWIPRSGKDNYLVNIPIGFLEGDDDNLWVGTVGGLAEYSFSTGLFENYDVNEGPYNPHYTYGRKTFKSSDRLLWFYSEQNSGLRSFNPNTQEITRYNEKGSVPDTDIFTEDGVQDLVEDHEGNILAAGDGVYILNKDTGHFIPLLEGFEITVTSLKQTTDGQYIAGTYGRGIYWLDKNEGIVKHVNRNEGLANGNVVSIELDDQGDVWIMHALGVSRYQTSTGQVVNYDETHGLEGVSGTPFMMAKTESGYLIPKWTNSSLSVFRPEDITDSDFAAPVRFTSVLTQNSSLPVISDHVKLPHDFGELVFDFSSPRYTEASLQQYRYRLSGTGQDWSSWSEIRSLPITGLPPATYNLQVQTRNADRVASPVTASYSFTITPPWYQAGLSRLLFALAGIGIVGLGALRYSSYRTSQESMRLRAEQAEELARIDSIKTNLLINISHELRTPLTLILGPLNQMADIARNLGHGWQRRLDLARRNGRRLQQLVEQVLDLTRLDANRMTLEVSEIELTSFLKRTVESFESMSEQKEITLSAKLPGNAIYQVLDKDKFEKIIVNLLSNALKFTPDKGTVTLELTEDVGSCHVSVKDTGRGIPREQLPHIFDRFHSTNETVMHGGQGLGIGLSITKQFVELHEGFISVDSLENQGTTFTISIPKQSRNIQNAPIRVEQNGAQEEIIPVDTENTFPVQLTPQESDPLILIVEDNHDMREYITDMITRNGIRTESAINGAEAKKKLALLKPDLIISDIMMPQMDGFEFAALTRTMPEHRLTPILILSAKAEIEDRIQGFQIGVSDYLVKPFDDRELLVRLQNLLKFKAERDKELATHKPEEDTASYDQALVNSLRAYVEERIKGGRTITTEDLSQEANLSRSQLYRNLKAATGFSVAEFVREIKLTKARTLLETRQLKTVSEVMYACGYNSSPHFNKLFKERYGKLPSDYLNP